MSTNQVVVIALTLCLPNGMNVDPSEIANAIAEAIALRKAQQPPEKWQPLPESVTVYQCAYDAGIDEASQSGPWQPE